MRGQRLPCRIAFPLQGTGDRRCEKIFEKARENIKVEIARAEERLKNKIVDIAIEAAEKVIEEKLSESGDRKLVEGFINKLSSK